MEVLVPGCEHRQTEGRLVPSWAPQNNLWVYKVMGVCKRHKMGSELMTAVSEEGVRVLPLRPPSYHPTTVTLPQKWRSN